MLKTSIALCTYNGEKYITEQLQSIFDQTIKPDEIVVSDDGSKDSTISIIESFAQRNIIPIRILNFEGNKGVFKNFIFCIQNCTGDIIFTCDQDDYWMPTKIEEHLRIHKNNLSVDLLYSNAEVVLNTLDNYLYLLWDKQAILDNVNGKASFQSLVVKGQSIAGCCMSFKKTFFDKIMPVPDKVYHDDWIATSAFLAGKIIGIPEPLIKYRQHDANVVGTIRGSRLSYIKSLFTNVNYYHDADIYIAHRHHLVYEAMSNHAYLSQFIEKNEIQSILNLYDVRANYREINLFLAFKNLLINFKKGNYKYLNGFWTFIKDLYNLIFIKIIKKRS